MGSPLKGDKKQITYHSGRFLDLTIPGFFRFQKKKQKNRHLHIQHPEDTLKLVQHLGHLAGAQKEAGSSSKAPIFRGYVCSFQGETNALLSPPKQKKQSLLTEAFASGTLLFFSSWNKLKQTGRSDPRPRISECWTSLRLMVPILPIQDATNLPKGE